MLSILVLGTPQVLHDGHAIQIPRRKNRALLFYLAAHTQPRTRDQILALFFIDHERAAAQKILRTMLHDLRKQLDDALLVQDETLALAPDVFVDARELETSLQRRFDGTARRFGEASLQLYRGDFLEGLTLPDAPEFDDWVSRERERYRALALRGWRELASVYEAERDYASALDALNHALAFDVLDEAAQRQALRVQYLNGDRAGAVRRFERLQKLLVEEMGVPPMPETRAVYDAIITDTLQEVDESRAHQTALPLLSPKPAQSLLPFTGRAVELQMMADAARAGKLIWLQGEPGIGKTRLAEEFIASETAAQALVLRGTAHELEAGLPYQPLIDALRSLLAQWHSEKLRAVLPLAPVWMAELVRLVPELGALFPDIAPAAPTMDEARVWEALYQCLRLLAQAQRVVLLLDDAHWADAATIGLVGYLARRLDATALTVIATARVVEPASRAAVLLETLAREDRIVRLALDVLSTEDLQTLALKLSPAQAELFAQWLHQNAEGNPFFVTELVRYAYRSGILRETGALDTATLRVAPLLPPTIQNLIASRLTRLVENARRVIYLAAVIGREFDFELVQRAAGLSEDEVLDALDALRAAGLIHAPHGGRFRFDHSLTMQVTQQEMGDARRKFLHRRVAEALVEIHSARLDAVAGAIARHFVEAEQVERAAPYAWRAGNFATQVAAWGEAAAFYELALQGECDESMRAKILIALGDAQFHQAALAQATESLRRGLELARAHGDFAMTEQALLVLTQSLFPQARYTEAIAYARELRERGPVELIGAAEFAWGTALAVESAQPVEAEVHLRAADEFFAQPIGYTTQVTLARRKYQLAATLGQRGDSAAAVAVYQEALHIVQTDALQLDITRTIMLYNNLGYHLHLLGDFAQAAEMVRAGIRFAQEKGSTSHLPYLLSTSGEIALAQKDLDAAETFFRQGLVLAEKIPIPERIAGITANLGLVAQARGQNERARQLLSSALERADAVGNGHLSVRIRIWLARLVPPAQARTYVRQARRIAEANGYAGLQEIDTTNG
jgi:DNA-binding SARP family transcriptional activator/tetratricopeptide (TPR) repeat protein